MISVVDTTLRITPQLGLSDAVTVRAQVDVASNMIWGGTTAHFFGLLLVRMTVLYCLTSGQVTVSTALF